MENLHNFFKLVKTRLYSYDIDDISTDTEYAPYRFIYNMNESVIYDCAYKIGEKLLFLEDGKIKPYGRCLLREFKELFTSTFGRAKEVKEKRIRVFEDDDKTCFTSYSLEDANVKNITDGEEYDEIYYFDHSVYSFDKDLDIYPLMTDCYHLMYILRNIFIDFGADLKQEAKDMELGIDFFDRWEEIKLRNNNKKEYKNKAFTLSRQVIAFETILSELLGADYEDIKKADITRFIQFMTGKYADSSPNNTEIIKLVKNKNNKGNYNEDCDFVAEQFKKIGLIKFADKIINGKE